MITHYDVQDNISKMIRLLDTCFQLNYQYPYRSSISISIDRIYDTLNLINKELLACIDDVSFVIENPSNNN